MLCQNHGLSPTSGPSVAQKSRRCTSKGNPEDYRCPEHNPFLRIRRPICELLEAGSNFFAATLNWSIPASGMFAEQAG